MKKLLPVSFLLLTIIFLFIYKPVTAAEDPPQPSITPLAQWGDSVTDIELVGNTIYIAKLHQILALSLSESTITEKSLYSEGNIGCQYSSLSEEAGTLAATASSFWCENKNQLKLFDISNDFITQTGVHSIAGPGGARSVRRYGGKSYIANAYGGLIAISAPGQEDPPTYLPDAPPNSQLDLFDIDIVGDIAYITDISNHILHIVGVANNTFTPLSTLDLGGNLTGIDVEGHYAYVAGQSGGLIIVDISNPQSPQLVSKFNTIGSQAWDVQVRNNYAFVINNQTNMENIEVIDVSDPILPKSITSVPTAGVALNLEVDDNNIYVAGAVGGLQIFSYTNFPIPEPAPSPFLELPWNYQGKTFYDAATSMFSFFDHEYPLLSASSLTESSEAANSIISYFNSNRKDRPYSSHDGYDWGRNSGLKSGDPVLAAANGCAIFVNNYSINEEGKTIIKAPGKQININHGNHYQTRYYHLQPENLITTNTTQCVNVTKGQQIGLVGLTGKTTGAHIHFMVVEDKNKDGNFEDNIPDGITDPFGWQTEAPDPWPNYKFTYKGQERTGNKSYYLWLNKIAGLNETLPANEAVTFDLENTKVSFPIGIVTEPAKVNIKKTPWIRFSDFESVGPAIDIIVRNFVGNLITQFSQFFTVAFNFSNKDLSRINPETLTIYSSSDGVNWNVENTTIDTESQTASAQVNHLTQFALMGERLDTESPITTLQQNENTFTLSATDNYSGVDYIAYQLDDSDWQEYKNPIAVGSGEHTVHFYSVDNHENIEEEKSSTFTVAPLSNLKIQYYPDPTARGESVNAIIPDFNIVNTGGTAVPLKELTIRYYFTRDSNPQAMYFYCDYAKIGCSRVKGKVVTLTTPTGAADSYIEIGFTGGTLAANGQTKDILVDVTREDEGDFIQTNDYSFDNRNSTFTDWSKVTLYRNGILQWGTPPN